MDDIISAVRNSLDAHVPQTTLSDNHPSVTQQLDNPAGAQIFMEEDQTWDSEQVYDANEITFDDTGEGAGVEGDLDMDDDWGIISKLAQVLGAYKILLVN